MVRNAFLGYSSPSRESSSFDEECIQDFTWIHALAECDVGRVLSVSQIWIKVAFFGGVVEASVSGKASL